jgi:hypothetical protein
VSGVGDDRFVNYLFDLGSLLQEKAMDAKADKDENAHAFNVGRLIAWHEIVSLMQSQAGLFGLSLSQIGLSDIDPERDLV